MVLHGLSLLQLRHFNEPGSCFVGAWQILMKIPLDVFTTCLFVRLRSPLQPWGALAAFLDALQQPVPAVRSHPRYGCLAPTSTESRAFTILYAFFSVPLITGTLAEFQRAWLSLCFRPWCWILSRCLPTPEKGNWIHIEESRVWVLSAVPFYFWGVVELATFLAATASVMILVMWALFHEAPGAFVSVLEDAEAYQMDLFDSIYYFASWMQCSSSGCTGMPSFVSGLQQDFNRHKIDVQ